MARWIDISGYCHPRLPRKNEDRYGKFDKARIGRLAGKIIGLTPLIPSIIILGDGITRRAEFIVIDGAKRCVVKTGGEEGADGGHSALVTGSECVSNLLARAYVSSIFFYVSIATMCG